MITKKKITMKDIAADSGVSVSSVSMILNSKKDVSFSDETINKVFDSAKKLGYQLKDTEISKPAVVFENANSKNIIAVFCPNISNAYYATISQSIEQAAYLNNYKTIILTTFRDADLEKEMIKNVINMNVKGIIFTMMPSCPEFLEEISKKFPLVTIGSRASSLDATIIETSNYTEGTLIGEHLFQLGHRHIAFITTTINTTVSLAMRYQRLKGIQDTFEKLSENENYSITIKEAKISPEQERSNLFIEHETGYNLSLKCLEDKKSKITAFIGNNDMVAYGIMDAILTKGYKIPEHYSVCGFDNDFASSFLPISLTTVEHYMQDKGKKAFEMLYEKINKKENNIVQDEKCIIRIEYKPKLIIRNSTGKNSKNNI